MNTEKEVVIVSGLLPLPPDPRDIEHAAVFGSVTPEKLPDEYEVDSPAFFKDQGATTYCTGCSITAVREDTEGVELSPAYQMAKSYELMGYYEPSGTDLRQAVKVPTKFGSVLKTDRPYELPDWHQDPAGAADPKRWPVTYNDLAKLHCAESYLRVDTGPQDTFDNIRSAMWLARSEKRSAVVGSLWSQDWINAPQGIIPKSYIPGTFGHAYKICGWKAINGEIYLKAQLSSGTTVGDRGYFYFPRNVVNREFTYGAYTYRDMPAEQAKTRAEEGIQVPAYDGNIPRWLYDKAVDLIKLAMAYIASYKAPSAPPSPVTPPVTPSVTPPPQPALSARERLYNTAKSLLGKDIARTQDELGCAEAVNFAFMKTFGQPIGGDTSTAAMYAVLKSDKRFVQIPNPDFGDIIISPTGTSLINALHGHVGIVAKHGIMSNNSLNGLWQEKLTEASWQQYYNLKLGFPTFYFRVV